MTHPLTLQSWPVPKIPTFLSTKFRAALDKAKHCHHITFLCALHTSVRHATDKELDVKQIIEIREDQHTAEIDVWEHDTSMSWSTVKTGISRFRAMTHKSGAWTSLTMSETPTTGPSRTTMMTLGPDAAKALYQQLHAVYGEKVK
jgi:hypothetical protein